MSLVFPAAVVGNKSQEDIKNCQMNDESIGTIYRAKLEGVKSNEQSTKYQIWNQLVVHGNS